MHFQLNFIDDMIQMSSGPWVFLVTLISRSSFLQIP